MSTFIIALYVALIALIAAFNHVAHRRHGGPTSIHALRLVRRK